MSEINFPEVSLQPITIRGDECSTYQAIINEKNGHVYGIPSTRFKLMKHEDGIAAIENVLKDATEFGKYTKEVSLNDNGSKFFATYKFDDIEVKMNDGNVVNPTIHMKNAYTGKTGGNIFFGAFRTVCSNGMVVGDKYAEYKRRTTEDIRQEVIMATLQRGMNDFSKRVDLWNKWLNQNTNSTELLEGCSVFRDTELENLVNVEEADTKTKIADHATFFMEGDEDDQKLAVQTDGALNKWIFYNILTQFISHHISSVQKRMRYSQRLGKIFK